MKRHEAISTMAKKLKCSLPTADYIARLTVKFDKKLNSAIDENKSLKDRVIFLEDLLRSQQMHEPRCTTYQGQCNCWLSVDISDTTL